jgi:hypothetical protein
MSRTAASWRALPPPTRLFLEQPGLMQRAMLPPALTRMRGVLGAI